MTGAGSAASIVGRVLSATVGGPLIIVGLRSFLNTPDSDASPPSWMESVSSMSPNKVFSPGMALFPIQIKGLAIFVTCVDLIASASLSLGGSVVPLCSVFGAFFPARGVLGP